MKTNRSKPLTLAQALCAASAAALRRDITEAEKLRKSIHATALPPATSLTTNEVRWWKLNDEVRKLMQALGYDPPLHIVEKPDPDSPKDSNLTRDSTKREAFRSDVSALTNLRLPLKW